MRMEKKLDELEARLTRRGFKRGRNRSFGKSSAIDIQEFKRLMVISMGAAEIDFLTGMEGFHFSWDWYDPAWEGLNASGRIRFPGISGLLGGDRETSMRAFGAGFEDHLWTAQSKVGWNETYDRAILIDDLGLGNAVLLDSTTGMLLLWLFNRGLFPLTLGIGQYFEQAFRFHGLHLWQRYFLQNLGDFPSELILNHQLIFPKILPELSHLVDATDIPAYLLIAKKKRYSLRFEELESTLLDASIDYEDGIGEHGANLPTLNKLILEYDLTLNDQMLAYFSSMGTYGYQNWKYTTQSGISASINYFLFGLREMFSGQRIKSSNELSWNYNTFKFMNFGESEDNDPDYEPLKQLWTFYWEEGYQVALRRSPESGKLEMVWSWDIPDFVPLQVDFETFIEALLACGGLQSWVFHLEKEAPPYKLVPFEEPLKEIFPEANTIFFHFHS